MLIMTNFEVRTLFIKNVKGQIHSDIAVVQNTSLVIINHNGGTLSTLVSS